jgi:arylsulfatase A
MKRFTNAILSAAIVIALLFCATTRAETRPPNIVVILADDYGVGDIHALYPSNKLATPNLDQLVAEGMHFTDAHSGSALCTPSRYGILTGRYAWRTRLQHWVLASYEPPLIDENRLTLPAFLKQHGYKTACMGKWHLGWNWPGAQPSRMDENRGALAKLSWDFSKPIRGGPTERGFDTYFGVDLPNYPPLTFIENDHVTVLPTMQYAPNKKNANGGGLAGSPMAPGWKFDKILPEITRRAVGYIHAEAKTEKPFFLYFAMTTPHVPIAPSKQFAGKSGVAPIVDYLMETDWSAGEVLKAIDDAGIRDNTIVIFTGDNGHAPGSEGDSVIKAGIRRNGPYRGSKGDVWEGGHREPLIVRWPGHVRADSTSGQLVCLNDLYATCAEIVGAKLPDNAAEDSFSFLPAALATESKGDVRTSLVNHSGQGEFAFREKDWKLVFRSPDGKGKSSDDKTPVVELYDLRDIAEKNNVASQHPEIVQKLTAKLQATIDNGRSRPGNAQSNDRKVRFDLIPSKRWAPAIN